MKSLPNNVVPLRDKRRQELEARNAPIDSVSSLFQGIACEAPPCPQWLNKNARVHYRFIVGELKKAGLIAKIDQGMLAILCTAYAGMKDAEEQIQALGGEYQETPNGYLQLSPAAIQWERHSSKYEKIAKQFGITVRARQTLKVDNPNQQELPGL